MPLTSLNESRRLFYRVLVSTWMLQLGAILGFLLLCSASSVQAQEIISCTKQKLISAQDALAFQTRLQDSYRAVKTISAEFLQTSYLAALDVSETSSGQVSFSQPAKMRWDYRQPEPQVFLFADSTIWFYQESQRQVLVDSADKVLLSDLPLAFLMGLGDVARDFSVLKACLRAEGIVLELEPKRGGAQGSTSEGGEKGLKGFQILIDPTQMLPIGARVVDLNGNITTVVMRSMVSNQELSEKLFEARFPKGTDIQDRRKDKEMAG